MIDVILDTDLGIGNDDCQALVLALQSPELRVLGVSVCAGNLSMRQSLANAVTLVEYLGRPATPVHPGLPAPLAHVYGEREAAAFGDWGDRSEPVWPFGYVPTVEPSAQPAPEWIAEQVLAAPGRVSIVAIGPLTNVAAALDASPRVAAACAEVVCLGGTFDGIGDAAGNATPHAEFNFWVDPEAAHAVLASGVPVRLIPLGLARQMVLGEEESMRLAAAQTRWGRLYATLLDALSAAARPPELQAGDALAVAALVRPELFTTRRERVSVCTEPGDRYGESRLAADDEAGHPAVVAVDCDAGALRDLLLDRLAPGELLVPARRLTR